MKQKERCYKYLDDFRNNKSYLRVVVWRYESVDIFQPRSPNASLGQSSVHIEYRIPSAKYQKTATIFRHQVEYVHKRRPGIRIIITKIMVIGVFIN